MRVLGVLLIDAGQSTLEVPLAMEGPGDPRQNATTFLKERGLNNGGIWLDDDFSGGAFVITDAGEFIPDIPVA